MAMAVITGPIPVPFVAATQSTTPTLGARAVAAGTGAAAAAAAVVAAAAASTAFKGGAIRFTRGAMVVSGTGDRRFPMDTLRSSAMTMGSGRLGTGTTRALRDERLAPMLARLATQHSSYVMTSYGAYGVADVT